MIFKQSLFAFMGLWLILAKPLWAQDYRVPTLTGPVVDEVNFFTRRERLDLENSIRALNEQHVAQIQVLIASSLQGHPIESAAIKIVDTWQLGEKGKDNGILFLIVPSERKMRLEVGRGLEGVIPDAIAKRIIQDDVSSFYKSGHYYEGTLFALQKIAQLAQMEFPASMIETQPRLPSWFMIMIFVFFVWVVLLGRLGRRGFFRGGRGGWSSGSWSNSGWGGGGSGWSSGGGSWSGGGGSFGGGGASGDW